MRREHLKKGCIFSKNCVESMGPQERVGEIDVRTTCIRDLTRIFCAQRASEERMYI